MRTDTELGRSPCTIIYPCFDSRYAGVVRIRIDSALNNIDPFITWLHDTKLVDAARLIRPQRLDSAQWRRTIQRPKPIQPERRAPATQRLVSEQVVLEVAAQLIQSDTLPRTLPHGFCLTEAFSALSSYLSQAPNAPIHIRPLLPPQHLAVSQLGNDRTIDLSLEQLKDYLVQWNQLPNTHVPSSTRIGNTHITAAELLVLMGQAALKKSNLSVPIIRVPDPRAPGLEMG